MNELKEYTDKHTRDLVELAKRKNIDLYNQHGDTVFYAADKEQWVVVTDDHGVYLFNEEEIINEFDLELWKTPSELRAPQELF